MTTIGVTGHQDIPHEAISFVERRIVEVISSCSDAPVGVAALAAGADQLFAKAILGSGGQLHVILPCQRYETTFSQKVDLDSFMNLLRRATTVETLDFTEPSEEAYLRAGYRIVDLCDLLIAVWDGKAARGKGGTADAVRYARERKREVIVVWPAGVSR